MQSFTLFWDLTNMDWLVLAKWKENDERKKTLSHSLRIDGKRYHCILQIN